jgi:hypothetical protein
MNRLRSRSASCGAAECGGPPGLILNPQAPDEEDAMKIAYPLAATGTAVVITLAVAMTPAGRGQPVSPPKKSGGITPLQARNQVDQLIKDLREARALTPKIGDRAIREKMELILNRAELRARDLSDELARARPAQSQATAPAALPTAAFESLLKGLKRETFDSGKATYIENFAVTRPMSCEQAAALLKCFDFDKERIRAAELLYPHLVDRENFHEVLKVFVFDSSKNEVKKAVGLK